MKKINEYIKQPDEHSGTFDQKINFDDLTYEERKQIIEDIEAEIKDIVKRRTSS
jgi:DNA-directed RNA polymerase beta' subunit